MKIVGQGFPNHPDTIGNSKVSFAEEYDEFLKHYQKTLKWDIR